MGIQQLCNSRCYNLFIFNHLCHFLCYVCVLIAPIPSSMTLCCLTCVSSHLRHFYVMSVSSSLNSVTYDIVLFDFCHLSPFFMLCLCRRRSIPSLMTQCCLTSVILVPFLRYVCVVVDQFRHLQHCTMFVFHHSCHFFVVCVVVDQFRHLDIVQCLSSIIFGICCCFLL